MDYKYKFMAYNRHKQLRSEMVDVIVFAPNEEQAVIKAIEVCERRFYELLEVSEERA